MEQATKAYTSIGICEEDELLIKEVGEPKNLQNGNAGQRSPMPVDEIDFGVKELSLRIRRYQSNTYSDTCSEETESIETITSTEQIDADEEVADEDCGVDIKRINLGRFFQLIKLIEKTTGRPIEETLLEKCPVVYNELIKHLGGKLP